MNSTLEKNPPTEPETISCSLWRRLGAIIYDSIVLACVVFLAWQPVPLIPEALHPTLGRGIRLVYLTVICFLFFGWFWCHGGQTLGMRAWGIKLVSTSANHNGVTWRAAWMRFISALLSWCVAGMGFLWSLFHHNQSTWHDILSQTRLVVLRKN